MIAMVDDRRLITQAEAARIAGVNPSTLLKWLRKGWLTTYKRPIDGRKMVDEEELRRKLRAEPES